MKKLTTLFIALFAIGAYAQVEVDEKNVNIDGTKSGFVVSIPYGTQKQIEKELKDELKDWKGKFSNKGFIFADDCKLKEMGKNSFDVFARVDENPEGGAYVSIAIDLGGAHLTSKHHNDQAKIIRARLQKFGINAAKNVVGEEVKVEEKILKEQQKDLEGLIKTEESNTKAIEEYKKKIEEAEKAIEEGKVAQEAKKLEITEQEGKVEAVVKKKEAVK